jgi:hypothetical protein
MPLAVVRAGVVVALLLGGVGVHALRHHDSSTTQANPIYGYLCVGGKTVKGRQLPEVCLPQPVSARRIA